MKAVNKSTHKGSALEKARIERAGSRARTGLLDPVTSPVCYRKSEVICWLRNRFTQSISWEYANNTSADSQGRASQVGHLLHSGVSTLPDLYWYGEVQLQFTFHLVQRLKSNAVTDLTSGIWNPHPSEEIKNSLRRKSSLSGCHSSSISPLLFGFYETSGATGSAIGPQLKLFFLSCLQIVFALLVGIAAAASYGGYEKPQGKAESYASFYLVSKSVPIKVPVVYKEQQKSYVQEQYKEEGPKYGYNFEEPKYEVNYEPKYEVKYVPKYEVKYEPKY
ncbi:hypothetical protein J6590_053655 [Homalodisca vitripennis]|nr:hypothetical protein J6590_053655 [Homalodisca vitripennis]